ncbi:Nn.00g004920.m01.CDS01 [Neocucurbitaria sp. VM-36]
MLPRLAALSTLLNLPLIINATLLQRRDEMTRSTASPASPSPSAIANPQHNASNHDHEPTYHTKHISDRWALFVAVVLGGIAFLCALVGLVWYLWRRHVRGKRRTIGNLMGLGLKKDQLDGRGKFMMLAEQEAEQCEHSQRDGVAGGQGSMGQHTLSDVPRLSWAETREAGILGGKT